MTGSSYLDIMEERHPSALDAAAIAHLRELGDRGDVRAQRILGRREKWEYDNPSRLPTGNPFQVGDVLAAYWAHRTGHWPQPGNGSRARPNLRPARITGTFLEVAQQRDMGTALRWLEMSRPGVFAALQRLRGGLNEAGDFSYAHPDKAALGAALTALSGELWSAVLTRQAEA